MLGGLHLGSRKQQGINNETNKKKQRKQFALTDQPLTNTHTQEQMRTMAVVHLALCAAVKIFLRVCVTKQGLGVLKGTCLV